MAIFSVSIRELRPSLPEVVSDVSDHMNRYIITKRGKPAAVIISVNDYDSMLESLGLQSSEALIKEIAGSDTGSGKRKARSLEDIKMEL